MKRAKELFRDIVIQSAGNAVGRSLLRALTKDSAAVFIFHRVRQDRFGIGGHSLAEIEAAVGRVKAMGLPIVSLDDVLDSATGNKPLPPGAVAFTADDGYYDQAEMIAPIFDRLGVPLTLFLITDFIDGRMWPWDAKIEHAFFATTVKQVRIASGQIDVAYAWTTAQERGACVANLQRLCCRISTRDRDELIGQLYRCVGLTIPEKPPAHYRPLTWDDARRLGTGMIGFGSHSATHEVFSTASEETAAEELRRSRSTIERELRRPCKALAWPIGQEGDFADKDLRIAAKTGYAGAFAVLEAPIDSRLESDVARRFSMPRISLPIDARQAGWLACTHDRLTMP